MFGADVFPLCPTEGPLKKSRWIQEGFKAGSSLEAPFRYRILGDLVLNLGLCPAVRLLACSSDFGHRPESFH